MLQPWLAGGSLIGVGKIDKSGRPIALGRDARPIVMEQVFRKLAFQCTFRLDAEGIRTRLLPHQLAVAVAGGAEALIHSARDWIAQNKGGEDMILLQRYQECLQYCSAISLLGGMSAVCPSFFSPCRVVLWVSFPSGL